ncbi:uncharacterized protein si:ch211-191i18.4 [Lates japonicus]
MRLNVFLLLICCVCLRRVDLSLPDFIPVTPPLQVKASVTRTDFTRLPGLCQRLKRRRVTILCRLEKFCWRVRGQGRSQGRGQKNQSGQVCRCPRGSRCSHFFCPQSLKLYIIPVTSQTKFFCFCKRIKPFTFYM